MTNIKKKNQKSNIEINKATIVSERLPHGTIIETVLDKNQAKLAIYKDGKCYQTTEDKLADGRTVVPIAVQNPLIKCGLVKFPSKPEYYGSTDRLVIEIKNFIHRYVDLSDDFELAATYYVLLSWVYDDFNEICYLRKVSDFGSGKTRLLKVLGAICYKAVSASGGTSTAALFHIIDKFNGTLILDEADYNFSDERSDIAKILNNGNAKGFPILRVSVDSEGKYTPVSYNVFCPKIIASRLNYQDQALESRFITEQFRPTDVRADIPITLPDCFETEALALRNKLLEYRFSNLGKIKNYKIPQSYKLEGRTNQIFTPLLSVVNDTGHKEILLKLAQRSSDELRNDRSQNVESQVLSVIKQLQDENKILSIKEITQGFFMEYADYQSRRITAKWIGYVVRKKLGLTTHRTNTGYIIEPSQMKKLQDYYVRYRLN